MMTQHREELLPGTFNLAAYAIDGKDIAIYRD